MTPRADAAVASVAKAAEVLKSFSPAVAALSVRQVSLRTGIPRSTAHALCQTLAQAGLLEVTPTGYRLGPVLLELGGQVIERTGLVRAAEGKLERLLRAPEQEVHLGQLAQGWVVYLDRIAGPRCPAMLNRVGQRAPAHLTGCGKAALSQLPFREVAQGLTRVCAENRWKMPDLSALRTELEQARRDGYIVSRTFQHNRTSVGAAILDSDQRPVGGVSVAGPAATFTVTALARARLAVAETAELISRQLSRAPGIALTAT